MDLLTRAPEYVDRTLRILRDSGADGVLFATGAPPRVRLLGRYEERARAAMEIRHVEAVVGALLGDDVLHALRAGATLRREVVRSDGSQWFVVARGGPEKPALWISARRDAPPSLAALSLPAALEQVIASPSGVVLVGAATEPDLELALAALVEARRQRASGPSTRFGATGYRHADGAGAPSLRLDVDRPELDAAGVAVMLVWRDEARPEALERALDLAERGALAVVAVPAPDLPYLLARLCTGDTAASRLAATLVAALWVGAVPPAAPDTNNRWPLLAADLLLGTADARALVAARRWDALMPLLRVEKAQGHQHRDDGLLEWHDARRVETRDVEKVAHDIRWLWQRIRLQARRPAEADNSRDDELLELVTLGGGQRSSPLVADDRSIDDLLGGDPPQPAGAEPPATDPFVPPAPASAAAPPAVGAWPPPAPISAPPTASPVPESVQFRAYVPPRCAPGRASLVDIWASLPAQAAEVARLATETGPRAVTGLRAGVRLERGARVQVRLDVERCAVQPKQAEIVWDGEPANATFRITPAADLPAGDWPVSAQLAVEGLPVGELLFTLPVAAADGAEAPSASTPTQPAAGRVEWLRSAFASYASADRAEVLARVQGMKKVAPDLDVFVDVIALRSGDDWQQRLEQELATRERLFLFWSRHAKASKWVDFEWRTASRLKGLRAIDPVPLDDPRDAPPPAELATLHFGDPLLPYLAAEAARRGPG